MIIAYQKAFFWYTLSIYQWHTQDFFFSREVFYHSSSYKRVESISQIRGHHHQPLDKQARENINRSQSVCVCGGGGVVNAFNGGHT